MKDDVKMLFMSHLPTPGAGVDDASGRAGSGEALNMCTLYIKWEFFLHCLRKALKGWILRLGCIFNSKWFYIKSNTVFTTGHVLKINNIYTYKEGGYIDIVHLTDVHLENGFLYCSLYFFSKKRSITVRQTLQKDASIIWRLMDREEYDELMSRKLWYEVTKNE